MKLISNLLSSGLLRFARNDEKRRHCEERSDEAIESRPHEEGFTLVELMVVIVIIGLLATVVVINVMPATDRAARTKAQADVATLEQGVEMYRLNNLRYPTSDEGLQALVAGNFIRRLPEDPWGNAYRYSAPGPSGQAFQIASLGADGQEGGTGDDEDITN